MTNVNKIVIGGYTIEQYRKIKYSVKEDAARLVSDLIDKSRAILDEMLEMNTLEEMVSVSEELYQMLSAASTISSVADVN